MCPSFHLEAPAKVNLGLRITGVRADGYHLIESLFAPLDIADAVSIQVEPAELSVRLELAGEIGVPDGDDNLAVHAARAFLDRAKIVAAIEIGLTKHTPLAAGLGGGSSDAAAVLRGLSRAFPDALEEQTIAEIALTLGADVPYFLDPSAAWVSGVGECREPAWGLPALTLLLANPGVALPTAEVYRAHDALAGDSGIGAGRAPGETRPEDLAAAVDDPEALGALLRNDLEPAATRLCPAIGRLRRALDASGARAVGMSGSGGTCYGVFPDPETAASAGAGLDPDLAHWWRVATTREWG